jgi:glucose-6-phosphate 1-dehydrogenase
VKDIWSSQYIDHIQISVLESIDIQGRVNFFEQTDILRDMVQSHLLQLVAVTAMDEPAELTSDAIRQGREQILQKVTPPTPTDVVRAQYAGYKDEVSNQQSNTETYTAMKFYIDSERWRDVPVYLRTGKALADKVTEIVLVYSDDQAHTNILTLRIKPNEGFALTISAKKPGLTNQQEEIIMDYCYDTNSGNSIKHDAYEKLLIDAMNGDQTLFPTTTEIMESWRFVDAIIANWSEDDKPPVSYDKASTGPAEANDLMAEEATGWVDERRNICTPRFKPPNSQ